ncbi:hypothetical protein ASU33_04935 [Solirubrum puertoriconensis]|uniref:Secretion system C-terminal sorting domain-containing protein n=1 Tax=Solirubrum puertoriconensis TaxID=1751427 RepID=A0A9X0HIU4_SOLP1|nr:hypothetical protein ASU33_04935 [Solirubrum puertoriconensis]
MINVARDLTVTNGNGLVNGPATGEPAGIRVIGLFRGVGGGTNNVYTGTLVTCSQLNRTVSGCTVPGSTTPEAEQTPPAGANNDPTCRSVLPVTLTSFAAAANGQNVQLTWTTAQEKNNDRFEVERSTDGTRYELVATVRGKGNTSTASSYTATDAKPLAGTSYYRLRQVDFDGTATYSQVAVVRNSTQQVYLTPNPATSQLGFEYAGGELQWRIVNSVGQLMKQGSAQVSSSVDVSSLRAGVYFFEVSTGGQRSVQKFFKQD